MCRDEPFSKKLIHSGIIANYSQRRDCECYFVNGCNFSKDMTTLTQEVETFVKLAGKRYSSPISLYNDIFGDNNG